MANSVPDCVIVLAAGKGSRMGSDTTHKVCFKVDGVPAVVRALNTYKQCGVKQNLVVVGNLAGQVVEVVGSEFPNSIFAYQQATDGTAGALRAALNATPTMDAEADVLIVAGDRLLDSAIVEQLFNLYYTEKCDLALLSLPTLKGSGSGRLFVDQYDEVTAIIEMADVRQKRTRRILLDTFGDKVVTQAEFQPIILENFSKEEKKSAKAFPELQGVGSVNFSTLYSDSDCLFLVTDSKGQQVSVTPDEAESLPCSNTSVYLTKRKFLEYTLANLNSNNAQQENYLSDMVAILQNRAEHGSMKLLLVDDFSKILGFNNPQELLDVSEKIRLKSKRSLPTPDSSIFIKVSEYIAQIKAILADDFTTPLMSKLRAAYGDSPELVKQHIVDYLPLLELAQQELGDSALVGVIRSPGRVNVMGRHVDHQGGNCNLMTINYETLMVVNPREDDQVNLKHLDSERFASCEFSISDLTKDLPWEDWQTVVDSPALNKLIGTYGVDWSHYVKAAVLRLQKKFNDSPLFGMNLFVSGKVPMAAGLSSSSSLIVGAAEAVVAVNNLDTFPAQLVNLCGEGEWFVGTRGGSADHAAVKFGKKNRVVKVSFFDFGVEESVPFPEGYVMVLCDSGVKANKAGGAKDQFNHRVACYRIGFQLLLKYFPQYAPIMHHLRDVNSKNLGVTLSRIYQMLLRLPEHATRGELEQLLERDLSEFWATHNEPADKNYSIRSVVLYGLAECARSSKYAELLKAGNLAEIGRLMHFSHDGDRVVKYNGEESTPFDFCCNNGVILNLIDDLSSGEPQRVINAQLEYIAGGYACSVPDIDYMVDVVEQIDGVIGAQLAGAGLGGCMMVLVKESAVEELKEKLTQKYYAPRQLDSSILVCHPIAGSGIIAIK